MKNNCIRKAAALILCAALCGCNAAETTDSSPPETSVPVSGTSATVSETPTSETSASENVSVLESEPDQPEKEIWRRLSDIPFGALAYSDLEWSGKNADFKLFDALKDVFFTTGWIDGEGESLMIKDKNICRESTLSVSGRADIAADSGSYRSGIGSAYNITYRDPQITLALPSGSGGLTVGSIQFGYRIYGEISLTGFLRKTGKELEFIIDPAYMRGMPVYSNDPEEMRFDVNGETVYMDSFAVKCENGGEIPDTVGENYCYAKVKLSGLYVRYSPGSGYDCTGRINGADVLTEDTKSAIEGSYITDFGGEKDPAMNAVFRALVNNLDTIITDDTYGVVLLDMDFDGTPEVLVSRFVTYKGVETSWSSNFDGCDTDIYRIDGENLKYIDTMHIAHMLVYNVSAVLGLKTLDDGTKAWFATTYELSEDGKCFENADCLFTLDGDVLKKTEVFRRSDSNVGMDIEFFYYFGEKVTPEIVETTGEKEYDSFVADHKYVWNGISSYFGVWELYGFARAQFCKDIKESFLLYSDWLIPTEINDGHISCKMSKKNISRRDAVYNLAYAVDAYYLGEYNPLKNSYDYRFLGDYAKPVIYLYPEQETKVSVSVDFTDGGEITCSYPEYNGGWNVTALPDGTIYNENGDEYYCLYWEGRDAAVYDNSKGWCVPGKDTAKFLREKLMETGLTAREANEFIIYWLPEMQDNPYNIITFHTADYSAAVPLSVSPAPDTVIRVFMTFEASDEAVEIQPQELPHYERNGFTLVEWGGSAVRSSNSQ